MPGSAPRSGVEGPCVVVGGAGFVGKHIVAQLLELGHEVVVFDLLPLEIPKGFESSCSVFTGDVRKIDDLRAAFEARNRDGGVKTVFHVASLIDISPYPSKLIDEVNVGGVENVLELCKSIPSITNLIYTSTMDVCFTGKPVMNGTEALPYASAPFLNSYIRTKGAAERAVLEANRTSKGASSPNVNLLTCAMRPVHVYGPGDMMIATILRMAQEKPFGLPIKIGGSDSSMAFVYVENLAFAHILAARKLAEAHSSEARRATRAARSQNTAVEAEAEMMAVGGEAFIICDFHLNIWSFMQPFFEALELRMPIMTLPAHIMFVIGWLIELVCILLGVLFDLHLNPSLSRTSVAAVSQDYYFHTDKARRRLGYTPKVPRIEAARRTIDWVREYDFSRMEMYSNPQRRAMKKTDDGQC